jgi:hypothetical protein
MTSDTSASVSVVQVDATLAAALTPYEVDFVNVTHGDPATYFGAYLQRFGRVAGVWWTLDPGYSPALIARDIATLSHLGVIERIAIEGDSAQDALEVISAMLDDEPVTMSTPFGELIGAVNRPSMSRAIDLYVGETTNEEFVVSLHSRVEGSTSSSR